MTILFLPKRWDILSDAKLDCEVILFGSSVGKFLILDLDPGKEHSASLVAGRDAGVTEDFAAISHDGAVDLARADARPDAPDVLPIQRIHIASGKKDERRERKREGCRTYAEGEKGEMESLTESDDGSDQEREAHVAAILGSLEAGVGQSPHAVDAPDPIRLRKHIIVAHLIRRLLAHFTAETFHV